MVVGYSPENTTNEFRNFTQLMSATFYCSTIGLGVPFSSNGRNLALKKSVFDEVKGFTKIKQHPCGEDKQLLQLVDKTEYKIAYNAKNKVYTKPVTDEFSESKETTLWSIWHLNSILQICIKHDIFVLFISSYQYNPWS